MYELKGEESERGKQWTDKVNKYKKQRFTARFESHLETAKRAEQLKQSGTGNLKIKYLLCPFIPPELGDIKCVKPATRIF